MGGGTSRNSKKAEADDPYASIGSVVSVASMTSATSEDGRLHNLSTPSKKSEGSAASYRRPELSISRKGKLLNVFERIDIDDDPNGSFHRNSFASQMLPDTEELLREALGHFCYIDSSDSNGFNIDLIVKSMQLEQLSAKSRLISEGEMGDKLYVVESGELEVYINGRLIRTVSRGSVLGELALLYNEPRTATIISATASSLWSLRRDVFRHIQASTASDLQVSRSKALIALPEFAGMSALDLSRLVGALRVQVFNDGDLLYQESQLTNRCIIVESGVADIYMPNSFFETSCEGVSESVMEGQIPQSTVDDILGIGRHTTAKTPRSNATSARLFPVDEIGGSSKYLALDQMDELLRRSVSNLDVGESNRSIEGMRLVGQLSAGCFMSIRILRGKALMNQSWKWFTRDELLKRGKDLSEGALCPCTIMAKGEVKCAVFTAERFETLFGPLHKAMLKPTAGLARSVSGAYIEGINTVSRKFKEEDFTLFEVLGTGAFGTVRLAECDEWEEGESNTRKKVAIKFMSKWDIVDLGFSRHVADERRILAQLSSVFIIKFYGTFQTPECLAVVTEALSGHDLWSLIYETSPFCENSVALPVSLVLFYVASLLLAFAHIHENGIAYRDLKPENVLLDELGYIRIIDFGFAKKVPFSKVNLQGELKVCAKTYTLCGTPEYLAPEVVFHTGHDQAVDLWSLGITIYEMLMASTPFAAGNASNVFKKIGKVKRGGFVLPQPFIDKFHHDQLNSLVTKLLNPEPLERMASLPGGCTRGALDLDLFQGIDLVALGNKNIVPEFIPPRTHDTLDANVAPTAGSQPRPYHGDNTAFIDF